MEPVIWTLWTIQNGRPAQVYYWSTNQVIVQRALAARSLADGQKGVLFAASMFLGAIFFFPGGWL